MNTVILIGYLGKDAESRTTRNNSTLTILSLATNRVWKDRETGERRSRTTWHRCVSFGPTAAYAATLTTGAHVQIEARSRPANTSPKTVRRGPSPKSVFGASRI